MCVLLTNFIGTEKGFFMKLEKEKIKFMLECFLGKCIPLCSVREALKVQVYINLYRGAPSAVSPKG
ncbi:MAG: hypothetical protein A2007_03580 [Verrucomicrobia bacterium GWC2_42_7]|nr:MAG: hypothetical protein A2007_03580 [Verrucomicrobia bacterium GWC2_42_7]